LIYKSIARPPHASGNEITTSLVSIVGLCRYLILFSKSELRRKETIATADVVIRVTTQNDMTHITKEQAAEILSMTTRAVERYTKQNRLSATYERGRTRPVPMYDEAEVRALAAALMQPSFSAAIVATQGDNNDRDVAINTNQALQRTGNDEALTMFVSMLSDAMRAAQGQGNTVAAVPLRDKMTLSFKEAAKLSGVPESNLRAAFADGTLRGAKIGRGVRVMPDDVRKYVDVRMKGK
jgi:excisionase family DNA binding protein